jgi:hypothetical protein
LTIGNYISAGRRAGKMGFFTLLENHPGFVLLNRYIYTTLAYQTGIANLDPLAAIAGLTRSYFLPHKSVILVSDPQLSRNRAVERQASEGFSRTADSGAFLDKQNRAFSETQRLFSDLVSLYDIKNLNQREMAVKIYEEVISPYIKDEEKKAQAQKYLENIIVEGENKPVSQSPTTSGDLYNKA